MFLIKPLSSLFGVLVLIYIGWIFLAGMPSERIDRGCRPVGWVGNIVTSIFAMGAPTLSKGSYRTFNNIEYGCQYAVWRLIYEKDWVEEQIRIQQEQERQAAERGLSEEEQPAQSHTSVAKRAHPPKEMN